MNGHFLLKSKNSSFQIQTFVSLSSQIFFCTQCLQVRRQNMLVANISKVYQTRTLTWSFHVESLKSEYLVFISAQGIIKVSISSSMENLYNVTSCTKVTWNSHGSNRKSKISSKNSNTCLIFKRFNSAWCTLIPGFYSQTIICSQKALGFIDF